MTEIALKYSSIIAQAIQELAMEVKSKPFLLRKVQDAAVLLKEVHLSLMNENGR